MPGCSKTLLSKIRVQKEHKDDHPRMLCYGGSTHCLAFRPNANLDRGLERLFADIFPSLMISWPSSKANILFIKKRRKHVAT